MKWVGLDVGVEIRMWVIVSDSRIGFFAIQIVHICVMGGSEMYTVTIVQKVRLLSYKLVGDIRS